MDQLDALPRDRTTPLRIMITLGAMIFMLLLGLQLQGPRATLATSTTNTLTFLQTQRDACQVMLDSATLNAERTRARNCINDTERAIAALLATPSPSASVTPTASPTTTSAPPTTPPVTPTVSPPPSTTWPGPDNTGVPTGTTLSVYAGPCRITTPNTVIDAKLVSCDLDIATTGVVITRASIGGIVNIDSGGGTTLRLSISDSVIDAGHRLATGLGNGLFVAARVEVRGGNRGVLCAWRCTLQDSWVHGTYVEADWHASGARAERYSTFIHNSLACDWLVPTAQDGGCSADLTGYPDFAAPHDWLIQNNLFVANPKGAAFCAYGGSSAGKPFSSDPLTGTNIVFRDNVFQRGTVAGDKGLFRCAFYGAIDSFNASKPGAVWSNNRYDDGILVVP